MHPFCNQFVYSIIYRTTYPLNTTYWQLWQRHVFFDFPCRGSGCLWDLCGADLAVLLDHFQGSRRYTSKYSPANGEKLKFIVYQADLFSVRSSLHFSDRRDLFFVAQKFSGFFVVRGLRAGSLAQIGFPERLSWVMEGAKKWEGLRGVLELLQLQEDCQRGFWTRTGSGVMIGRFRRYFL